jgi:hypothetical protein
MFKGIRAGKTSKRRVLIGAVRAVTTNFQPFSLI